MGDVAVGPIDRVCPNTGLRSLIQECAGGVNCGVGWTVGIDAGGLVDVSCSQGAVGIDLGRDRGTSGDLYAEEEFSCANLASSADTGGEAVAGAGTALSA